VLKHACDSEASGQAGDLELVFAKGVLDSKPAI
jgi:hypothetical protein